MLHYYSTIILLQSPQTRQMKAQAKNANMRMAAEQFKNAIDHLGSKEQPVVLGGVHVLHNLAMTFPKEYSRQVFEVLCSFIREETRRKGYPIEVDSRPSIVIQTILDKLFREDIELINAVTNQKFILYRKYKANLSRALLQRADLSNASLRKANLRHATLHGADLFGADLRKANLELAEFGKARLWNTKLQGAKLEQADFGTAQLLHTKLQGANLNGAKLNIVPDLNNADFRGIQSQWNYDDAILKAKDEKIELKTDLRFITLIDDNKNALQSEDEKKNWLRKRGAKVDDLPIEEVQELFKDFVPEWFKEERGRRKRRRRKRR